MRVKRGFASRRKHRRLLKRTEGYRGRKGNCYKLSKRALQKALQHSFRHRRAKKRDFRRLWITRIGAASREAGLSYSLLIKGLRVAKIDLDRKALSEIAMNQPAHFLQIVERARGSISAAG